MSKGQKSVPATAVHGSIAVCGRLRERLMVVGGQESDYSKRALVHSDSP